ncbi:MAG: hypothetical protein EHM47_14030 [Ignavibacteriales bacterium]|nr:MAG: hypothetical protein EHM47_14030 [Ignavibacteriales bacterium]
MKYLVGIDGGGTKTRCIAADNNGKLLFETSGGPSNFLVFGIDKVCENLFQLLEECTKNLKCNFENFSSVVLGTAGAGRKEDVEKLTNHFLNYVRSKNAAINNFTVLSDARIALEGAFSGRPGSILISGTGSIMFGKDAKGTIHRVGGFGRFIGDEGSGYSIGKKGLAALSKFYDGRGSKTVLSELVDHFGINSSEELINAVYKNNFDIASAAQQVILAAEKDDDICKKIINDETDELILHIIAMKEKLKQDIMEVSFTGSVITTHNYFSRLLHQKIKIQLPGVKVIEPEYNAAMGAVLMAKEISAA